MTRINMIGESEASDELSEIYAKSKEKWGRIGTIAMTMGHKPNILKAFGSLGESVRSGEDLSPQLMEKIILRVSKLNGCEYCLGIHTIMAKKVGLDDNEIKVCQMDNPNDESLKDDEKVALKYAGEVTKNVRCTDETFEELKKHYNEAQIVQLTSLIAFFNYLNRFNDALEVDIDY